MNRSFANREVCSEQTGPKEGHCQSILEYITLKGHRLLNANWLESDDE